MNAQTEVDLLAVVGGQVEDADAEYADEKGRNDDVHHVEEALASHLDLVDHLHLCRVRTRVVVVLNMRLVLKKRKSKL